MGGRPGADRRGGAHVPTTVLRDRAGALLCRSPRHGRRAVRRVLEPHDGRLRRGADRIRSSSPSLDEFHADVSDGHVHRPPVQRRRRELRPAGEPLPAADGSRQRRPDPGRRLHRRGPSVQFERRFLGMHRLRDLKQAEPVYQLSDGDFPPILSLDARTRRLPKLRTETVGRTNDIREVTDAIERRTGITLIGPGGVGKTRLALEVAAEATLGYARNILADGLCFCDLAPITDPATLPELVGASLELPHRRHQTIVDSIIDHLRHRRTLLLLDNCEHLVEPCADSASMLRPVPRHDVLMTSRSPLGLAQERLYTVAPMWVPPKQREGRASRITSQYVCFLRGPGTSIPNCRSTPHRCRRSLRSVAGATVCRSRSSSSRRAAGRSPCARSSTRCQDEQVILPWTRPSAFERQRTIENAVAWSYKLLDSEARTLLNVASVFAPEFDLAALRFVGADRRACPRGAASPTSSTCRCWRAIPDRRAVDSGCWRRSACLDWRTCGRQAA